MHHLYKTPAGVAAQVEDQARRAVPFKLPHRAAQVLRDARGGEVGQRENTYLVVEPVAYCAPALGRTAEHAQTRQIAVGSANLRYLGGRHEDRVVVAEFVVKILEHLVKSALVSRGEGAGAVALAQGGPVRAAVVFVPVTFGDERPGAIEACAVIGLRRPDRSRRDHAQAQPKEYRAHTPVYLFLRSRRVSKTFSGSSVKDSFR